MKVSMLSPRGSSKRAAKKTTRRSIAPRVAAQQAKDYDAASGDLQKIARAPSTPPQRVVDLRGAGLSPDDTAFVPAPRSIAKIDEGQLAASAYLRDAPEYFAEPQKQ